MTREKIIQTALAEVGYKEEYQNRTKFGKWYHLDEVPWCAIFISYIYDKAGHPMGKVDTPKGFHYCPSAYNFWKKAGKITTAPEIGDIILFDWNKDFSSDHTGIFNGWVGKDHQFFFSVEGNTSVNNQSDGGSVMQRQRHISTVQAFVNLLGPVEEKTVWIKGDVGDMVKKIQCALVLYGHRNKMEGLNIAVDGDYSAETFGAVKIMQKHAKLDIDGEVGPNTRKVLGV